MVPDPAVKGRPAPWNVAGTGLRCAAGIDGRGFGRDVGLPPHPGVPPIDPRNRLIRLFAYAAPNLPLRNAQGFASRVDHDESDQQAEPADEVQPSELRPAEHRPAQSEQIE